MLKRKDRARFRFHRKRSGRAARLAPLALALALAACQVRPLYAPGPDNVSVAAVLPAIEVAVPETRPEQMFRNALLFRFRGGDEGVPPRYRLDYELAIVERSVAIEQFTGTPAAYQVVGSLAYVFSDATGEIPLLRDTATTVASYDRSTQEFANVRALRDAEERVAEALAEIVAGRIAARLAAD